VIENVPGPAVLVTVGFAVNVNAPAVPPLAVLVTVIVPFLMFVPPVFNAGTGAENVSVAPVTVNGTELLLPPSAVTVTFRGPVPVGAMVNVAVTVVSLTAFRLLTVIPEPDTLIVSTVLRWVPVRVTLTEEPLSPELGLTEVSVGAAGAGD
jgi:hypothetical protein